MASFSSVVDMGHEHPEPGLLVDQFLLRPHVQHLTEVGVLQRPIELTNLLWDPCKQYLRSSHAVPQGPSGRVSRTASSYGRLELWARMVPRPETNLRFPAQEAAESLNSRESIALSGQQHLEGRVLYVGSPGMGARAADIAGMTQEAAPWFG